MNLIFFCPRCHYQIHQTLSWPLSPLLCPSCQINLFEHVTDNFSQGRSLDQCPVCGGAHLYRRKDFNQKLGIFLVVLGVGLAYFTFGISLLVVTLIDFYLVRKVKEVGICYQCNAQFRNSDLVISLEPFNLEMSDYYQNLKRSE